MATTSFAPKHDAAGWSGAMGEAWVRAHERQESMLQPFCLALVDAVAPDLGDNILDIGCGCGATTFALASRCRRVVGVDISAAVVSCAREAAAQKRVRNVSFVEGDVQRVDLGRDFDHAVSRAGVMFFDDPVAAFRNIGASVRDGGRLTFVSWRAPDVNELVAIPFGVVARHVALPPPTPGAPGPFALADPDTVTSILRNAGWTDVVCTPIARSLVVGGWGDARQAAEFFVDQMSGVLAAASVEVVQTIQSELQAELLRRETADGVVLECAACLVSAVRPWAASG